MIKRVLKSQYFKEKDLEFIQDILKENDIVIVSAPTGTGKSRGISKYMSKIHDRILVTEPLRAGAVGLSHILKEELEIPVGLTMKNYDEDRVMDEKKFLMVMTTGSAVRRLWIHSKIDLVIVDEYHMRSIDIDVFLSDVLEYRKGYKILIMSATIDLKGLEDYIKREAPDWKVESIEFEGYTPYEIKEHFEYKIEDYIKYVKNDKDIARHLIIEPGLVEISNTVTNIIKEFNQDSKILAEDVVILDLDEKTRVIMLHSKITGKEMMEYLGKMPDKKEILVSTNLIGNSVTIVGLKSMYIPPYRKDIAKIDDGLSVIELREFVKSEIIQLKGRLGRTMPGEVYYNISKEKYDELPMNHTPDILKANIDSLILMLTFMKRDLNNLKLRSKPSDVSVKKTYSKLEFYEAIKKEGDEYILTKVGEICLSLGIDVEIGLIIYNYLQKYDEIIKSDIESKDEELVKLTKAFWILLLGKISSEENSMIYVNPKYDRIGYDYVWEERFKYVEKEYYEEYRTLAVGLMVNNLWVDRFPKEIVKAVKYNYTGMKRTIKQAIDVMRRLGIRIEKEKMTKDDINIDYIYDLIRGYPKKGNNQKLPDEIEYYGISLSRDYSMWSEDYYIVNYITIKIRSLILICTSWIKGRD